MRAAYGGVAPVPLRMAAVEAALDGAALGEPVPPAALAAVDGAVQPISDVRASEVYRRRVAVNLLRRLWLDLAGTERVRATPEVRA